MTQMRIYQVERNYSAHRTFPEHLNNYADSTPGIRKSFQFIQKTVKLTNEIVKIISLDDFSSPFKEVDSKFGFAVSWLGLFSIPRVTQQAIQSFSRLKKTCEVPSLNTREWTNVVRSVAKALTRYGSGCSLLTGNPLFRAASKLPKFILDATDLQIAFDFWSRSQKMSAIRKTQKLGPEMQTALGQTEKYALFKLIKAILSVTAAVLSVFLFIFGSPFFFSLGYVSFSWASSGFSAGAYFYKETRPYKIVKFYSI